MQTGSEHPEREAQGLAPSLPAALAVALLLAGTLVACTPTVKVEAPDKPIEINMNVNIKHEILVKVEKDVEAMFEDEDIF
ncbi:MAG: YnbE family lipoprotein [Pseudomonadota bacterium]